MADEKRLPFHRKYRPTKISDYIGNEKVKRNILNTLSSNNKPQVVLLSGDSGCGKTSFARLLAKEYSCMNRDAETGACCSCAFCKQLDDYIITGSTDVLTNVFEINMSEHNGKNDFNSFVEQIYMPAYGDEWKIFIFDECHKATDALQNALLKVVEEPPEKVLLIFCTTNPEKLIETLKNRCQVKLHIQKPTLPELYSLLKRICEKEDIEYDKKGLEFIANRSDLVIRTSLQSLENVANVENSATYDKVTSVLDAVANINIVDFFKTLKNKDTFQYIANLMRIKDKMDLSVFLTDLMNFVRRGIYVINGLDVPGVTENDIAVYKQLFGDMGVAQITFILNKLLALNTKNLELELLYWGYTGLEEMQIPTDNKPAIVTELADELKKEDANTHKMVKEKEKNNYEQGVKNAGKLMEGITMEDLLNMGATIVN